MVIGRSNTRMPPGHPEQKVASEIPCGLTVTMAVIVAGMSVGSGAAISSVRPVFAAAGYSQPRFLKIVYRMRLTDSMRPRAKG